MNAVRLDAEGGKEDITSLHAVVLQLSLLFEAFVLLNFPQYSPDKGTHKQTHTHTHTHSLSLSLTLR